MLTIFAPTGSALKKVDCADLESLPESAVWIDMFNPTPEEDRAVEGLVRIAVPTREEMQEIEISSRLYVENGARYMTATLMCAADSPTPRITPVTFILTDHRLVTVRYDEPKPFALTAAKLARNCPANMTGDGVLLELLDGVIDRCADILERAGADVVELGVPFSDPLADGGGNQDAARRALLPKGSLRYVVGVVKDLPAHCAVAKPKPAAV